jgi:hypothetical protein
MLYMHFEPDKALQAARDDAWEDAKEEGIAIGETKGRTEGKLCNIPVYQVQIWKS